MIRKPSPIHSLWKACKIISSYFGYTLGIVLFLLSVLSPTWQMTLAFVFVGGLMYWFAGSIAKTLLEEERKEKRNIEDEDESTN